MKNESNSNGPDGKFLLTVGCELHVIISRGMRSKANNGFVGWTNEKKVELKFITLFLIKRFMFYYLNEVKEENMDLSIFSKIV